MPLLQALRDRAHPLDTDASLDPLFDRIGDARIVMLGEATHGTSEYYTWRARISQRLIKEKGFNFIAVEGDWPDCYEVNRYVKSYENTPATALEVLHAFDRWPTWMWANWELVAFAEWLKIFNETQARGVGFYGLDVYSLWESMDAVLQHLEAEHPEALDDARQAFSCFEPFNRDAQAYAWATLHKLRDCANDVLHVLGGLRQGLEPPEDPEEHFNAEQNAHVAVGAENYYRAMVRGDGDSWNVRDTHMMDTLDRLLDFHGPDSKAIVWEHNTHIGDARATDMAGAGMVNIGQLARERYGEEKVVLVGFGSYSGTVIAGERWGAEMQEMRVPEAQADSWEALLHEASDKNQLLIMSDFADVDEAHEKRGHRAIGVVYQAGRERLGNYVPSILPMRYDAFLFFHRTRALHPLHVDERSASEPPETYPWGL